MAVLYRIRLHFYATAKNPSGGDGNHPLLGGQAIMICEFGSL